MCTHELLSQIYDFFRDQGSIIAGLIALAAGIIAYRGALSAAKMQVEAQQQSEAREVDTLRKSLAIEIRQMIGQALAAHNSLKRLVAPPTTAITARMVENSSRIPSAVIYPGNASKIGLLGGNDAMEIVIVYNLIDAARDRTDILLRTRTPDNIAPLNVGILAGLCLTACQRATQEILPKFKTGFAVHDDKDDELINRINVLAADWEKVWKALLSASG
jgi:hypothetical protein